MPDAISSQFMLEDSHRGPVLGTLDLCNQLLEKASFTRGALFPLEHTNFQVGNGLETARAHLRRLGLEIANAHIGSGPVFAWAHLHMAHGLALQGLT